MTESTLLHELIAVSAARTPSAAALSHQKQRFETVVASFGAPAAGGVFVPMNPLLKPEQVGFIAAGLQRARAGHLAGAPGSCWRPAGTARTCAMWC
jgi:hypothetical protein